MKKRAFLIQYIIIAAIISVCVLLNVISRLSAEFSDFYRNNVFLKLQNIFSRISGALPFSLGEAMIAAAILLVLSLLIIYPVLMIRKKDSRKKITCICSLVLLWTVTYISVTETLNCFIMYQCGSFASVHGISEEKFASDELYALTVKMTQFCSEAEKQVLRDENGNMLLTCDVSDEAGKAMRSLSADYPTLSGYYPQAKEMTFSRIMTGFDLLGIYFPFSLESNFNSEMYNSDLPDTVCHEFAHLKGWIREDEANFIAYLACIESDSPEFCYSGAMSALSYLRSKVWSEPSISDEEKAVLNDMLSPGVRHDLVEKGRIFRESRDTKVGTVMSAVSDRAMETSLRLNGVSDGVKSYGRFVDLLLNYYCGDTPHSFP